MTRIEKRLLRWWLASRGWAIRRNELPRAAPRQTRVATCRALAKCLARSERFPALEKLHESYQTAQDEGD